MARSIKLLNPQVKTEVLDNLVREKAEYLVVPEELGMADFKSDVRLGAVQYREIRALVEKEKEPRYILISVENLEQGYMAVAYLAALFNEKHGEIEYAGERPLSEEGEWRESPFAVPLIDESDLKMTIGGETSPFAMGDIFAQANQLGVQHNPYWMKCRREAVCIVSNPRDWGGGLFPFDEKDAALCRCLDYFASNEKVYILNVEERPHWIDPSEDMEEEFYEEESFVRSKWNYLILSFAIDEISVKLKKEEEKRYFRAIFKGVFQEKGLCAGRGFSMEKILNLILKMREPGKCKLIEYIIQYAVKDWKEGQCELTNQDFAFLDRFFRADVLTGRKKKKRGRTAREQLLDSLIGMEDVKEQVLNVVNVMKYNRLRAQMNIAGGGYHNVHIMLGAPGTAKTTVAGLMGQIMVEEHLLPDNRFTCVNGAELKGRYVGHSAPKTKALFEENDIIVIDEAYSLISEEGEGDSFSREAVAQLIIELEKHSTDKLVIFAGYGGKKVSGKNNKMKQFLDSNPGIKSRITSTIYFDSYTPDEMVKIFFKIAENQHYCIGQDVAEDLREYFRDRVGKDNFGNGREARSLLETTVIYAAKRVFAQKKRAYTKQEMQKILREDVLGAIRQLQQGEQLYENHTRGRIGFNAGVW